MDILLRFAIGGIVVSAFSLIGGLLKPTSFAGLFGAAPSVALATLALTIAKNGRPYAATECRSMIAGSVALGIYSLLVSQLIARFQITSWKAALASTAMWIFVAFGLWRAVLR